MDTAKEYKKSLGNLLFKFCLTECKKKKKKLKCSVTFSVDGKPMSDTAVGVFVFSVTQAGLFTRKRP